VKKLLLLRHAQPVETKSHSFLCSPDIALSDFGRRQAASILPLLKALNPERCLCSPFARCIETARLLSALDLDIEIEPDLREIDFGRWTGMSFEQIRESDPDAVNRWAEFDPDFSFPGGERIDDFLARVGRMAAALASGEEKTILAVTHGGIIRAMICHYLCLHPRQYILFDVGYASLTTLNLFGEKGVLAGLSQGAGING
jgi:broad specificity phosphatase PhoE